MRYAKKGGDKGMDDRVISIPYLARFIHDPVLVMEAEEAARKANKPCYIKLADNELAHNLMNSHINEMASYYLDGSVQYYKNDRKLEKPASVIAATNAMLMRNDIIQQFIGDKCIMISGTGRKTNFPSP